MPIVVACPNCSKSLRAPEKLAGKTARCPACKQPVKIPPPAAVAEESDDFEYRLAPLPDSKPTEALSAHLPLTTDSLFRVLERASAPERTPSLLATTPPVTETSALATRAAALQSSRAGPRWRRFLYLIFAATLIPLAISMFSEPDDVEERLLRTLESVTGTADAEITSEDDLFRLLPDERIEGAYLPRFTGAHWGYAAISAIGFLGAVILSFDLGRAKWWQLVAVAASTATVGIVFLLMVQWIAAFTGGWLISRNPLFLIVYYAFKFIGFSYNCAVDPNTGFLLSFFGFTFGVGLLEEFTKAMPILFMLRGNLDLDWRGAAVWGLASGIGLGVAEGIIYSADFYNGVAAGDIYVVRFVSCVGLHAIWAASVAVMITRYRDEMQQDWDWSQMLFAVLKVQAVPMVLHGLYDVMLKKDMNFSALLVALLSFLWLAFMIERSRREEGKMMARNAARWARSGIA